MRTDKHLVLVEEECRVNNRIEKYPLAILESNELENKIKEEFPNRKLIFSLVPYYIKDLDDIKTNKYRRLFYREKNEV